MSFTQCSFEDLIAESLSALDRAFTDQEQGVGFIQNWAHPESLASVGNVPNSIDSFLAGYRHELNSIRDFMMQADDISDSNHSHSKDQSGLAIESACCSSGAVFSVIRSEHNRDVSFETEQNRTTTTKSLERVRSSYCMHEIDKSESIERSASTIAHQNTRRCVRIKMSAETKQERRRNQNREYQRRYREKRIQLEMQRLTASFPTQL